MRRPVNILTITIPTFIFSFKSCSSNCIQGKSLQRRLSRLRMLAWQSNMETYRADTYSKETRLGARTRGNKTRIENKATEHSMNKSEQVCAKLSSRLLVKIVQRKFLWLLFNEASNKNERRSRLALAISVTNQVNVSAVGWIACFNEMKCIVLPLLEMFAVEWLDKPTQTVADTEARRLRNKMCYGVLPNSSSTNMPPFWVKHFLIRLSSINNWN